MSVTVTYQDALLNRLIHIVNGHEANEFLEAARALSQDNIIVYRKDTFEVVTTLSFKFDGSEITIIIGRNNKQQKTQTDYLYSWDWLKENSAKESESERLLKGWRTHIDKYVQESKIGQANGRY